MCWPETHGQGCWHAAGPTGGGVLDWAASAAPAGQGHGAAPARWALASAASAACATSTDAGKPSGSCATARGSTPGLHNEAPGSRGTGTTSGTWRSGRSGARVARLWCKRETRSGYQKRAQHGYQSLYPTLTGCSKTGPKNGLTFGLKTGTTFERGNGFVFGFRLATRL